MLEILPAVIERDLAAFGAALSELVQAQVGACKLRLPRRGGGIYASAQASKIVDELHRLGFVGVGQSSWGPSLYAFSACSDTEITALAEEVRQRFGLDETSVFCTKAANQGASC